MKMYKKFGDFVKIRVFDPDVRIPEAEASVMVQNILISLIMILLGSSRSSRVVIMGWLPLYAMPLPSALPCLPPG